MKKNLFLIVCLLITLSIPAQEASQNLKLKNFQQGFNAQPGSFDRTSFPVAKSVSEETGYVKDSTLVYNFYSQSDSDLIIRDVNRYNSDGTKYAQDYIDYSDIWYFRRHYLFDETGNSIFNCQKAYDIRGNPKKYTWVRK